ncbi:hypothetical protein [Arthrobacter woluwensis]|uniref:Alpha/beta hydrolase n=1 Tax=Arthrobacter woluwensis TaxID=156980 RepID=A0A1H4PW71_9MICC|nr:hypothetical protein [Arthrobacter woluwensis]SEC11663.1 hypothetical protein SAMN04489745_2110 [Arthrobacter woluwensis]
MWTRRKHLCRPPGQRADAAPEAAKPDHVVLFVHGMGRALKGGTLQEWAQPLMLSLHDEALACDDAGDHPPLIITEATAVGDAPQARVKVLTGCSPSGGPEYLDVLMTEASWAKDFEPATVGATFWWAMSQAKTVYKRCLRLLWWTFRPADHERILPARLLTWLLLIPFISAVAALGFLLILGILLLGMVLMVLAKIPALGRFVSRLLSLFADFLGDPQVWKRKQMQAAAMRQRIRETLAPWNGDDGVPVTVVAHSQGAAIVGQVLFQRSEDPVRATNFVSVGSGIDLLGYAEWGGTDGSDPVQDWLDVPDRPRWVDVWGKFDFVPAGPISRAVDGRAAIFRKIFDREGPGTGGPGPDEHPVYNRSALVYDHVVYSRNRIEVIDPLARLILSTPRHEASRSTAQAPVPLLFTGVPGDERLRPHRVMVKSLGVTRLAALVAAMLTAPALMTWFAGRSVVRGSARCAADPVSWLAWLCPDGPYRWANPADWSLLAVATLVLTAVQIWVLNGMLWSGLHGLLERRRKKSRTRSSDPKKKLPPNPWWQLWLYLAAALVLTFVLPWLVLGGDLTGGDVLLVVPLLLYPFAFLRTGIRGLAARV